MRRRSVLAAFRVALDARQIRWNERWASGRGDTAAGCDASPAYSE